MPTCATRRAISRSSSSRDLLGDEPYAAFKKLDIGDIIGVKGEVFRTKMGEISVRMLTR